MAKELHSANIILTGRFLADQQEFALFETLSGRVHRLSGVARQLCERAVHYDMNLTQALKTLELEQKRKDALSSYLQKCEIFGKPRSHTTWRKILTGRIELPVFQESWVQQVCTMLHPYRISLLAFLLIGLVTGSAFWHYKGGILSMNKGFEGSSIILTLIVINTLLHELGHAYALHYHGQKPGVIGFKVFGPMLAAYTDVNRAWMLEPHSRAMVSISGILVQICTTFMLAGLLTSWLDVGSANLFVTLTLITIAFMALPIRENDGDWFLRDIIAGTQIPWLKSGLSWVRRIFWGLGLGFFAFILYRGWFLILPTLIEKIIKDGGISSSSGLLILIGVFILMGTWSFIGMLSRGARALWEGLASYRGSKKVEQKKELRQ